MVAEVAELDYAMVAEYAKVENARLSLVGGGYTELVLPELPTAHVIAVAGRIRAPQDTELIQLEVRFSLPGDVPDIIVRGEILASEATHRYKDRIGILFALNQVVALTEGLCVVAISLDGTHRKNLKFDVRPGR